MPSSVIASGGALVSRERKRTCGSSIARAKPHRSARATMPGIMDAPSGCGKSVGGATQIKPIKVARRKHSVICIKLGEVCREEVFRGGVVQSVCRCLGMVRAAAEVLFFY